MIINSFVNLTLGYLKKAGNSQLLTRQQNSILNAAVLIMASYAASTVLGLVRERLLLSRFYVCCKPELDTYLAAFRLPDMLFQLLVIGALSAAFIPVFSGLLEKSAQQAYQVASGIFNGLFIVFTLCGVIIFFYSPQLSELITGSFSSYQLHLMASLTRVMLVAQFLFLISNFLSSIIQAQHRFLIPALAPVLYNLGIIGGIVLPPAGWGLYGPAIGVVAGAGFHLLIQIPLALKLGLKYHWYWNLSEPHVKDVFRLMLPRSIALGINQLQSTAALFFATSLASGSLVLFSLAQTLMYLPIRLIGTPIGQAAFPTLAKYHQQKPSLFKQTLTDSLLQVCYLVLPATAILIVLRIPIVRLTYGSANFPWIATKATGWTLAWLALAIPAQAIIQLLVRSFYAYKDTVTPLIVNLFSTVVFIIIGYDFSHQHSLGIADYLTQTITNLGFERSFMLEGHSGLSGLALAISAASLVQVVVLAIALHHRTAFIDRKVVHALGKQLVAVAVMAYLLKVLMQLLDRYIFDTTRVVPLIALTVTVSSIGLAIYIILCHAFKVKQQYAIWGIITRFPGFKTLVAKTKNFLEPVVTT